MERAHSNNLTPALVASAALHVGVVAAGFIVWPHVSPAVLIKPAAVPVTIVSSAPVADVRPAVAADVQETAAVPEPVPEAVPAPPAPVQAEPAPAPAPTPKPAPAPKPALDLDALAKNLPKPKEQPRRPALDLNALAANLRTPPQPRAGPTRANAEQGPARVETDVRNRPAVGAAQGLSGTEIDALRSKLIKLWNPNCGVEGAANVVIRVEMRLTPDGRVIEAADLDLNKNQSNPVLAAASQRALSAVARGQPYSELSRDNYAFWRDIRFTFNAREACR